MLFTFVAVGCATPAATIRVDTPPQRGAALDGWVFFFGVAPHLGYIGSTSRTICEAGREKLLENQPHAKPSPCVPARLTAD